MNAMITVTRYENESNSNALCLKKYNKKITMKNKEKNEKKKKKQEKIKALDPQFILKVWF